VKCDLFNRKEPVWDIFHEETPGTFTRLGQIQRIAFGMQGPMTFKLRHTVQIKGGQIVYIKLMKV